MRETPEPLPYGEHLPALYRFAFLMTGSFPAAAEVLQQTVENAERGGLRKVYDPRKVKRWLFAQARTICGQPLPAAEAVPGGDVPIAGEDPARQLATLFRGLPETERAALLLFYLYQFGPDELAEVLGVPPNDLGTLLNRGRTLLQRQRADCDQLFAAA